MPRKERNLRGGWKRKVFLLQIATDGNFYLAVIRKKGKAAEWLKSRFYITVNEGPWLKHPNPKLRRFDSCVVWRTLRFSCQK